MPLHRPALFVITISQALLAQQTLTVGPNGQFADLPPAVAAASPGDTILIEALGVSAAPYSATTISKGLTLLGSGFGTSVAQLLIVGVPANERVVIHDFAALRLPGTPTPTFRVANCAGLVLIEDFCIQGISGVHAEIENCDHVVLRNSLFIGQGAPHEIVNSHVIADDCEFHLDFGQPTQGCLSLSQSELTLTNSLARSSAVFLQTAAAMHLDRSSVQLIGSTLDVPAFPGGPHIIASCIGPSLVLRPSSPPPISQLTMTGCVTSSNANLPSLSVSNLVAGAIATLRTYSNANTAAFVFAGKPTTTLLPTAFGSLALQFPNTISLLAITTPAQGVLATPLPIPSQLPVGTTFAFQAASITAQAVQLSTPTVATVR